MGARELIDFLTSRKKEKLGIKAKGALFSIVVITNYHKISGLQQHKYIKLQFCRLEICHIRLKSASVGAAFLSEASREEVIYLPFLPSGGLLSHCPFPPFVKPARCTSVTIARNGSPLLRADVLRLGPPE